MQWHEWLLTNSAASKEERKPLSPYLKAILYRNMLSDEYKELLSPCSYEETSISSNQSYRYLFRLLIGVDILRNRPGDVIRRNTLQEQYKRWFPELPLTDMQLCDELKYGINYWIQRKLIRKVSKYKSNEYVRISTNEEAED